MHDYFKFVTFIVLTSSDQRRDFLFLSAGGPGKGFYLQTSENRAANNGWSTDNFQSKLGTDWTNPWIAGHLVWSFTDSFKEILIFNCLIITSDNSHVSERKKKKKKNIKVDKLVVEKEALQCQRIEE